MWETFQEIMLKKNSAGPSGPCRDLAQVSAQHFSPWRQKFHSTQPVTAAADRKKAFTWHTVLLGIKCILWFTDSTDRVISCIPIMKAKVTELNCSIDFLVGLCVCVSNYADEETNHMMKCINCTSNAAQGLSKRLINTQISTFNRKYNQNSSRCTKSH